MYFKKSQVVSFYLILLKLVNSLIIPYSNRPEDILFLLYTKGEDGVTKSQSLEFGSIESLQASAFRPDLPTVLLIHGYWCDTNSNFPAKVRDAYLETLPSQNYIVVDWGRLSHPGTSPILTNVVFPLTYLPIVLENLPIVSSRVADFIQFLVESQSASLSTLHVVGHSLGAHISGWVGHLIQGKFGGQKIGRITGLDPAGPGFGQAGLRVQRSLRADDGGFTDVYHTAMGSRGDTSVDGHVDFYPNGGVVQPSCPQDGAPAAVLMDPFGRGSCSHEWASDMYAATIRRSLTACKCNYWVKAEELEECLKNCPEPVLAGEKCPNTARGIYYFVTEGV